MACKTVIGVDAKKIVVEIGGEKYEACEYWRPVEGCGGYECPDDFGPGCFKRLGEQIGWICHSKDCGCQEYYACMRVWNGTVDVNGFLKKQPDRCPITDFEDSVWVPLLEGDLEKHLDALKLKVR